MGNTGCCVSKSNYKEEQRPLDLNDKLRFMKAVKVFNGLSNEEKQKLADQCRTKSIGRGTVIYHEGDYGTEFYIIAVGTVTVHVDGVKSDFVLGPGDHFGEGALLRDTPRTATVTTETPVEVLVICRKQFLEMELHQKLSFEKRKAVGGHVKKVPVKPPSTKTEEEVKVIMSAIKNNVNLTKMIELDDDQIQSLCDAAWEEKFEKGTEAITQGDMYADYFYVVKDGSWEIDIEVQDQNSCSTAIASHMERVGTVTRGSSFGELGLLYSAPRAATVKALELSTLWVVDRNTFKKCCARKADHYAKMYVKYLEKSKIFGELEAKKRMAVAKALMECNFRKGEHIYEQGEEADYFYILYEGEVSATKNGSEIVQLKASAENTEMFGELAMMNAGEYETTMTVISKTAKTLSLDKESFDMLLGHAHDSDEDVKDSHEDGTRKSYFHQNYSVKGLGRSAYATALQKSHMQAHGNIYFNDLKILGLLGCGGFGYVELVEHKKTKEAYALKSLSKGYVVQQHQEHEVMMEKEIQCRCDSDFIVRLYETYTGDQVLFLLLELGLGGELYHTYQVKGFWGQDYHCKYYTASVIFAFDHLHRKKMIYRDLKPENILFNDKGNAKLTDLGLATVCIGKTFTTCGTAPYLAPEVITAAGHNRAADWWMVGILTYELMTGHTPFEASSAAQIFAKISKGISQVRFPPGLFKAMKEYVKSMCSTDPSERPPMKKGGIKNIEKHPYYAGFAWATLKNQSMTPPYIPKVGGKTDMTNFQCREEDKPPQIPYEDDGTGWDKEFATSTFEKPSS